MRRAVDEAMADHDRVIEWGIGAGLGHLIVIIRVG
jgi:hypothetical protein